MSARLLRVAPSDFADRLEAETYRDDDGRVGVFEVAASDADALWLSERLFRRLTLVAQAYELHTLPLLGGVDAVTLTKPMCASLVDELGFITDRLDDQLAHDTAQALSDFILHRLRRPGWDGTVIIEGD